MTYTGSRLPRPQLTSPHYAPLRPFASNPLWEKPGPSPPGGSPPNPAQGRPRRGTGTRFPLSPPPPPPPSPRHGRSERTAATCAGRAARPPGRCPRAPVLKPPRLLRGCLRGCCAARGLPPAAPAGACPPPPAPGRGPRRLRPRARRCAPSAPPGVRRCVPTARPRGFGGAGPGAQGEAQPYLVTL